MGFGDKKGFRVGWSVHHSRGGKLPRVWAADYGFCGGAFVAVLGADDDPEGDCAAGLAEAHSRLKNLQNQAQALNMKLVPA